MFSDVIKSELEREIVGQTRAVRSVVRGVTRIASGLTPRERSFCAYMFMGPTGTGKTHLIQTLARLLHGDEQRTLVADCSHLLHADPGTAFAAQLAPLFTWSRSQGQHAPSEAPPLSIIQIEFLERGPPDVVKTLAAALEAGQLALPDGRRASLRDCLVFVTSGLCAAEILDEAPRIGFTAPPDDDGNEEADKLHGVCLEEARRTFGDDLLGRLDDFVVFHRLREEHLPSILDRRIERLDQWLARRGVRCDVRPPARDFLLGKSPRELRLGARDLLLAHRKFVEFPIADILVSGRVSPGQIVVAERRPGEDHLHFTVTDGPRSRRLPRFARPIPVAWDEPANARTAP